VQASTSVAPRLSVERPGEKTALRCVPNDVGAGSTAVPPRLSVELLGKKELGALSDAHTSGSTNP
jgi:hypothetical protein